MNMNGWKKRLLTAALSACCLCGFGSVSASAITVDDVAEKARECGYSEEMVQLGYNEWASGSYTEADLQMVYDQLCKYDDQADEMVDSIFDAGILDSLPTTTPPTQGSTQADTSAPEETTGSSSDSTASSVTESTETPATEGSDTVTSADFINMTLDEKIAYVNSMSEEDREAFLDNLTAEERNSIIKQMSLTDKAELMQGYIDTAETMGLNVVVDSLTDTNISVTIRNQDGVIIDKAAVGVTIDETGISHTRLIVLAAAAVLLSMLGFAALYRYLCRSDAEKQ